jgi:hypothetical protein
MLELFMPFRTAQIIISFGFCFSFAAHGAPASGSFSILGNEITWQYQNDRFEIYGLRVGLPLKIYLNTGEKKIIWPISVANLNGDNWDPVDLFNQEQANVESSRQIVSQQVVGSEVVVLNATDIDSWEKISLIPTPVRVGLRSPMRNFVRNNYRKLVIEIKRKLNSGVKKELLPEFLRYLAFPRDAMDSRVVSYFRMEEFEIGLGTRMPFAAKLADGLMNKPAPTSYPRKFFAYLDPSRPQWNKPTLMLVHLSQEFHYPVSVKPDKWIEQFRKEGHPIAFLFHNDKFNDASYLVKPQPQDFVLHTESGHHPLCENCPAVTFAGGFIDYCLGLSVRAYIANYFREKTSGQIQINLAADSIYTETFVDKGSEGPVTALMEIQKDGMLKFMHERIAQYIENYTGKYAPEAICPIHKPMTKKCIKASRGIVLSEMVGRDKANARFYPHLKEKRYLFRFQVDGQDFAHPLGDEHSPRTIIFNVLTTN